MHGLDDIGIRCAPEELDVRAPVRGVIERGPIEERHQEVDADRPIGRQTIELCCEGFVPDGAGQHAEPTGPGDGNRKIGSGDPADTRLLQRVPTAERLGEDPGDQHSEEHRCGRRSVEAGGRKDVQDVHWARGSDAAPVPHRR